ncbi:MAG: signal peptidase I [Lachnospiraceae bacterium]|nr:signal peptidase I [Lachnospiraceae bacterium]
MEQNEKIKNIKKEILSYIIILVVALAASLFVARCVIIKVKVPTGSMLETIQREDQLIGLRLAYLFSEPERGDIIIFPWPDNEEEIYIKRVIGLPGETIEIVDGQLYIDDVLYEEDYIREPMRGSFGPYEVPEDSYFVMGDNRNGSEDSRAWKNTFVSEEKILAKAWLRYKPTIGFVK